MKEKSVYLCHRSLTDFRFSSAHYPDQEGKQDRSTNIMAEAALQKLVNLARLVEETLHTPNFYDVLQLTVTASSRDIESSGRRLRVKLHPNKALQNIQQAARQLAGDAAPNPQCIQALETLRSSKPREAAARIGEAADTLKDSCAEGFNRTATAGARMQSDLGLTMQTHWKQLEASPDDKRQVADSRRKEREGQARRASQARRLPNQGHATRVATSS